MVTSSEHIQKFTADFSQLEAATRGAAQSTQEIVQRLRTVLKEPISIGVTATGAVSPSSTKALGAQRDKLDKQIRGAQAGAGLGGTAADQQFGRLSKGLDAAFAGLTKFVASLQVAAANTDKNAIVQEALNASQAKLAVLTSKDIESTNIKIATETKLQNARQRLSLATNKSITAGLAEAKAAETLQAAKVKRAATEISSAELTKFIDARRSASFEAEAAVKASRIVEENLLKTATAEALIAHKGHSAALRDRTVVEATLKAEELNMLAASTLARKARIELGIAENTLKTSRANEIIRSQEAIGARVRATAAESSLADVLALQLATNKLANTTDIKNAARRTVVEEQLNNALALRVATINLAGGASGLVSPTGEAIASTTRIETLTRLTVVENELAAQENIMLATNAEVINSRVRLAASEDLLAGQKIRELATDSIANTAKANKTVATVLATEQEALALVTAKLETEVGREGIRIKAERLQAERRVAVALRDEVVAIELNAGATRRQAAARADAAVPGARAAAAGGAAGAGAFLGSGFRSVLRFAIPSVVLFGTARAISSIVKEAEELIQVNVRLEAQFENLARGSAALPGAFDSLIGGVVTDEDRFATAQAALGQFRGELSEMALAAGLGTEEVFKLGTQMAGLFASFDNKEGFQVFAAEATEIATQLARISGLAVEDTFNDLVGAIRSFSDSAPEALLNMDELGDDLISIADVTGVNLGELLDFIGRIAPIAETVGLSLAELGAIGATVLQGSAVGGAALAEQMGRIFTNLAGEVQTELLAIAESIPKLELDTVAIISGETGPALLQIANNFDKITDSQQAFIINTLVSNREGNTFTTLLQNNSTLLAAFNSTLDNAGVRTTRFADVMVKLTGQMGQLKTAFEQLGQRLLNAGLGELLIVFVEALTQTARAFELLVPLFQVFESILDVLPDGIGPFIIQLSILKGVLALTGRELSITSIRLAAMTATQATATVASRKLSVSLRLMGNSALTAGAKLAKALGPLIALTVGFSILQNIGRAGREATEAMEKFDQALIDQNSSMLEGLDAAERYLNIINIIRKGGEGGDKPDRESEFGTILAGMIDEDDLNTAAIIVARFGAGVDQLAAATIDDLDAIRNFQKNLRLVAGADKEGDFLPDFVSTAFGFLGAGGGSDVGASLADVLEASADSENEAIIAISAALEAGAIDLPEAQGLVATAVAFGTVQGRKAEQLERTFEIIIDAAIEQGDIDRQQRRDLFGEFAGSDTFFQDVFNASDLDTVGAGPEITDAINKEIIENISIARERLEAGLIGDVEFSRIQIGELERLERLVEDFKTAGVDDTEGLADTLKNINDETADAGKRATDFIKARFEGLELVAFGEGIDPDVQAGILGPVLDNLLAVDRATSGLGDRSALRSVVEQLIEVEIDAAIALAERAPNAEAAIELLQDTEFTDRVEKVLALFGLSTEFPDPDFLIAAADGLQTKEEELVAGFEERVRILGVAGAEDPSGQVRELSALLTDPRITSFDVRQDLATKLADALNAQAEQQVDIANGAIAGALTQAEILDATRLVDVELIFAALSITGSAASNFLGTYLQIGGTLANGVLSSAAVLVNLGATVANAVKEALETARTIMVAQLRNLQRIFASVAGVIGIGTATFGAIVSVVEEITQIDQALNAIAGDQALQNATVNIGGGFTPGAGAGGSGSDTEDAASTIVEVIEAMFAVLRARVADDPVAIAKIAQLEAKFDLDSAENLADEIRAEAARIDADRELANAIQDVYNAEQDLIQAILGQAGDISGQLQSSVDQARQNLQFLRQSGAGDAAIASATASVLAAEQQQTEGLINEQIGDLQFLFDIGQLTQAQFVAQLEAILAVIDPIAQKDLFQSIKRTLLGLEDAGGDLRFNIPDSVLPAFLEVRRLAQLGVGGGPSAQTQGLSGGIDNSVVTINFNVNNGLDWENASQIIAEALGVDNQNFAFNVKRY